MIISAEVLLPLINYDIFNWNLHSYILINFIYGLTLVAISALLCVFCTTHSSVYLFGMFSMVLGMLFFLCLQLIVYFLKNTKNDVIFMGVFILCVSCMWCFELTVQRSLLGSIVSSENQGTAEAIRNGLSRVGQIFGSLVTPLCMGVLPYLSLTMMCIILILIIVYALQRNQFINPAVKKDSSFSGKKHRE